jgi:hypothetical protein
LQSWFLLGVGVGLAAITGHAPSQSTVEPLQMIGMNILVGNILRGVGVFWLRRLIFGPFAPPFASLAAFILEPNLAPGL